MRVRRGEGWLGACLLGCDVVACSANCSFGVLRATGMGGRICVHTQKTCVCMSASLPNQVHPGTRQGNNYTKPQQQQGCKHKTRSWASDCAAAAACGRPGAAGLGAGWWC
ncbi:uncharacterized protein B0H64DRAFT_395195 [Chaetomium fimeti]|uniref:Secreted protein n=1 Tax=Chaetomium fimeti TaxID=1854472 RepID=A0AAE0HFD7_9PEZI|nr:hypothetical protein B0H64DRAFT_395195 [Chaetomium fimeti]